MLKYLEKQEQEIRPKGLWRSRIVTQTLEKAMILSNAQKYINFCSSDYLGLSNHPRIKMAMQSSLQKFGFGSSSSPLLSGYSVECKELEKTFCNYLGFEDALVFPSGYQANVGVLSSLLTKNTKVLCDRLCHASILDGILLSRSKLRRFRHNDASHAHALIKAYTPNLLITESVFSMEGDIAPIDELSSLSLSSHTPFFVDDAHGFGVLGKNGLGTLEHWKSKNVKPDILTIPFGKALGMSGAIVLANKNMINFILQHCRSYRYSTAISPIICTGVLESLDIMLNETWRLEKLKQHIHVFNQYALDYNLPLISHEITPIRSLHIGDSQQALAVAKYLKNNGIYVAAIRPPTVPENTSRLRISLTCTHHTSDIHHLAKMLKEALQ